MTTIVNSTTRYEQILRSGGDSDALAQAMAKASASARKIDVRSEREEAIRDVAAGVAGPALVGYVLWILAKADDLGLDRLCFLSRDAQVLYEIALRLAPRIEATCDLRYVYSSRRTWSLAAADNSDLTQQDWLFNSFMRSNAEDVCARLGVSVADFTTELEKVGASLDPNVRADDQNQSKALRQFVRAPSVAAKVGTRISRLRELIREYAVQEDMTSSTTGLVDAGWTGRMIGALSAITEGLPQPKIFFWGHEPRATGWTDATRVESYTYNTASKSGLELRVPDTPYIIETFCMSDHGIVADYDSGSDGVVRGVMETVSNPSVEEWGLKLFRDTIYRFCDALDVSNVSISSAYDFRIKISQVLDAFWITPTYEEAAAWGAYPYDSDPLARATRPLARAFDPEHLYGVLNGRPLFQEDRAWLQGSLELSGSVGKKVAAMLAPHYEAMGAPATD